MYRIDRIIDGGGFHDFLMHLWEGTDLPVFIGSTHRAYLFDDKATADRVAQRLAAKCSETLATPHIAAKPIKYEVVEVSQHAWGRYQVFSNDAYRNYPNVVPAARYDRLDDAKKHADSVTYKMFVADSKNESSGIIYANWEFATFLTPDTSGASQLACNIVNATFLSLDGFEGMRKQMAGSTYTAEHFGAELARIVDRELSAETAEVICEHTGMTGGELEALCGTTDSADASDALLASPPTITSITRTGFLGSVSLAATFSDGTSKSLFSYYADELEFLDADLIGLTDAQAHELRHQRDLAYLRA